VEIASAATTMRRSFFCWTSVFPEQSVKSVECRAQFSIACIEACATGNRVPRANGSNHYNHDSIPRARRPTFRRRWLPTGRGLEVQPGNARPVQAARTDTKIRLFIKRPPFWIGSSQRLKPGAFGGVYEKILSPKLSDSADAHRVLPQKPKLESLNLGHTFLAKAMRVLR